MPQGALSDHGSQRNLPGITGKADGVDLMGTNYYVQTEPADICATCGHVSGGEDLHIGKSSAGWVFMLNAHPEYGINTFNDWVQYLCVRQGAIKDEYGKHVTYEHMILAIVERSHPQGKLKRNHADDDRWVNGEGTWDISSQYVDFS